MKFLAKRITLPATLWAIAMVGALAGMRGSISLAVAGQHPAPSPSFLGEQAVSDRHLAAWVEQRIQQWQVSPGERRLDEIGWAKDIGDAERLARLHKRPIFLFTHAGRMAIGRC